MKLLINMTKHFEITNSPGCLSVLSRITRLFEITIRRSDLRICEYILDSMRSRALWLCVH